MYNRKSKISAILAILTSLLLIGFMVLLPCLQYKAAEGEELAGLAIIIVIIYGYPILYAGAIPYAIISLILGIKMLKQQSRKKLISLNVRMLITTCVLFPLLAIGMVISSSMAFHSTLGPLSTIYTVTVSLSYIAGFIVQIFTLIILKKSPKEDVTTLQDNN